jgi:hypothetical protein
MTKTSKGQKAIKRNIMSDVLDAPPIVDRSTYQAELDALRIQEKAHTREGGTGRR